MFFLRLPKITIKILRLKNVGDWRWMSFSAIVIALTAQNRPILAMRLLK